MLSKIPDFRRVVGQSFEPPSHTHWRYDFRDKSNFCAHSSTLKKIFWSDFRTSFVFSSGSGLGKRYFSEIRVRIGICLGKKSGFNDPRFGASSFLHMEYDDRILSARTHRCMLKQFSEALYPNFKPTAIPLPKPDPNQTERTLPKP